MNIRKLSKLLQVGELLHHRYYMVGLCLQKGMPLIAIPLTLRMIGAGPYTQYVLIYTLVQLLGVLGSMSLPQSLFPFWYENENKDALLGSLLLVMSGFEAAFYTVIACILYFCWPMINLDLPRLLGIGLILLYCALYNLNALLLNLLRLRMRQKAFLGSTAISSFCLLAMIYSLRYLHGSQLLLYTAINIAAIGLQSCLFLYFAGVYPKQIFPAIQLRRFVHAVIGFSLPYTAYTLLTLLVTAVDKWLIRAVFSTSIFSQYVLDMQFSFALSFFSIVICMYNSQQLCELVYKGDKIALRNNLLGNYGISLLGSVGLAVCIYVYATLGKVHLSSGFWLLTAAYMLNNCYNVNSNLLSAQKRSMRMFHVASVALLLFGAVLSMLWIWKSILIVYLAYFAYYSCLLIASWNSVWHNLRTFKTGS